MKNITPMLRNDNITILRDTQVLHRAGAQGVLVTRQQAFRVGTSPTIHIKEFWADWRTGKEIFITTRLATSQEKFALIGA